MLCLHNCAEDAGALSHSRHWCPVAQPVTKTSHPNEAQLEHQVVAAARQPLHHVCARLAQVDLGDHSLQQPQRSGRQRLAWGAQSGAGLQACRVRMIRQDQGGHSRTAAECRLLQATCLPLLLVHQQAGRQPTMVRSRSGSCFLASLMAAAVEKSTLACTMHSSTVMGPAGKAGRMRGAKRLHAAG